MKIKIINPNTTQSMTDTIGAMGRAVARPDTEVYAVSPSTGPDCMECHFDEFLAIPGVFEEIVKGDRVEGADAYIIACFGDPGIQGARELTDKPVVGIAESAVALVKFLAPSFSIISTAYRTENSFYDMLHANGAQQFCRSVRLTGMGVLEFGRDPQRGLEALRQQCHLAVKEDRAEAILLGCAGFVDFVEQLREELGVPVLDGVGPAVKIAETLLDLGYRTSKINTWAKPFPKVFKGFDFAIFDGGNG